MDIVGGDENGQIFQVYRLTNVRYEQSQTATGVAGAVSSGYQSGGIQESGAIFPTYAGMSGLHTTGPVVDLSKCCLCQHRNFRASQKPCGHCVCENCCVGHSFQPCKRCGRIVTEVWAMDPTI
ncbi:hypothetical protein MAR_017942 [Mya arenaria]|uniref:Uncharacterized protein n=1 Tax=Mya arenaria TaxID=6604 RepID=A0ABY7EHW0_MYAAR|nr:hypothetical protein MAR_017942 [Mya arenaria]